MPSQRMPCHPEAVRASEIFISYRREDSPAHAGRLYDALADEFGSHQVFMDVDALAPGDDFVERLRSAIGTADVVLVVIGRGWLNAKNRDGERRLDDPEDFVRLEVGLALQGDPVVIPVLVGGATMPTEDELPPELALLSRRNALTMIDADWRAGMARLVPAIRRVVDPVSEPGPDPTLLRTRKTTTVREEREDVPAPPIPALATWLALAGAAALAVGTFAQVDAWVDTGSAGGTGLLKAVAPIGLLVGGLGALGLSYARGARRIATGVLLGFALAGVARYLSFTAVWAEERPNTNLRAWAALALVGSLLLVASAVVRLLADHEESGAPGALSLVLVIAGGALVVAGTLIDFNTGPEIGEPAIIDRNGGKDAIEPIGAAVLAVGVAFLLGRRRSAASGALIGLGTFLVLLFAARYIGFPASQPETTSEVAAGGFAGLAGGAAILAGGLVAVPRGDAGAGAAVAEKRDYGQ